MKILVLLSRVPYPIEKGDKLRAYNFIRELSKSNEIHLFAVDDCNTKAENIEHLKQYCKTITVVPISTFSKFFNAIVAFLKGIPLQAGFFYSKHINKIFKSKLEEIKPDHIFCQLIRVNEYVRFIDLPKTIDIQDTMSLNFGRSAKQLKSIKKYVYKFESKRLKKYEHNIFNIYDNKILISESDKRNYPHKNRDEIRIIPNGVDYNFFKPVEHEKTVDVIFTGNMGYIPNVDGSIFLVKEILPILIKEKPEIRVMIAGANPHSDVKHLESKNVIITGWVEDIRKCYSSAKIFIAPMRIGTGLQNKLLEAMAMQMPCITTSLANESLKAKNNEEILIADDKTGLAKHIINLLNNEVLASKIALNGYDFVKRNYDWTKAGDELNNIIQSTKRK
ncbi:MAG: glycosyltransferase [Bacteroidales bacterium]|jgi:sugar transferase (PEP-CTERM/EpsH1 system associated)|nr:glycosyltransferase [Bacteroidales bacterium]